MHSRQSGHTSMLCIGVVDQWKRKTPADLAAGWGVYVCIIHTIW